MSLSSFFLILYDRDKKETRTTALYYFILMHLSFLFLLLAFVGFGQAAGQPTFEALRLFFVQDFETARLILMLVFCGFAIKAGFVPFHTWLPRAHPAAPSHISGFMSAIMIKTGIYGLLRIATLMPTVPDVLAYGFIFISLTSGVVGVAYALVQHDIKKLLAYSSIENIGLIGLGMGLGFLGLSYQNAWLTVLGFGASLLHVFNHSLFKNLLFMGAGALYQATHTRDLDQLGGLAKKMPVTSLFCLVGSAAIIGLPLFNGFASEFLFYLSTSAFLKLSDQTIYALTALSYVIIIALALIAGLALVTFTKFFGIAFLGAPRSQAAAHVTSESPWMMRLPMGALALLVLALGLFPQYAWQMIEQPLRTILKTTASSTSSPLIDDVFAHVFSILTQVSHVFWIFLGIASFLFLLRQLILWRKQIRAHFTWGCGYQGYDVKGGTPSHLMEYTGSSYIHELGLYLRRLVTLKIKVKDPLHFFPKDGHVHEKVYDQEEIYLITPLAHFFSHTFVRFFLWFQSGSTQRYLFYTLTFLIFILLWIVIV